MPRPKWVGVYWTEDNQFSIMRADAVKKEEMFSDSNLVGMVEHQGSDRDKPSTGWESFPGRVIASGSE